MKSYIPVEPVSRELRGHVFLATIDKPPVHALSVDVRRGLLNAVEAEDADSQATIDI
jgi:3-hydroxyacyl-CoA dehydrogenase